jgi:hypothetical protein
MNGQPDRGIAENEFTTSLLTIVPLLDSQTGCVRRRDRSGFTAPPRASEWRADIVTMAGCVIWIN